MAFGLSAATATGGSTAIAFGRSCAQALRELLLCELQPLGRVEQVFQSKGFQGEQKS